MAEPLPSTPDAAPPAAGARRVKGAVGAKLALVVASLVIAGVLGEVATRIIGRAKGVNFTLYMRELTNSNRLPKGLQVAHPTLRWTLNPGEDVLATTSDFVVNYKVNGKGLRDKEYPYKKPAGVIRAVALGDSLTFGEGIPYGQRYTDIAEQSFSNLEVLTMGVPGYGLDQMMLTLAEEGIKYEPDVVMLIVATTVVSRHSLGANWLAGTHIDQIAALAAKDQGPSTTVFRREGDSLLEENTSFLLRRSYLLSYLNYNITLLRLRRRMAESDQKTWGARPFDDKVLLPPDGPAVRGYNAYLAQALGKLAVLAQQFKFQIVVVNIDPSWNPSIDTFALPPNTRLLDFADPLRAEAQKHTLRWKYDPHYTPATNALIGQLLVTGLQANVPGLQPRVTQ